ncbi:T9SS type A sorting domain-containing protein [Aquimarina pacifica]|uniref:T9SS type A sorting domain-containing protein n=1 Tax=Aquimarina pacifica TaxID=1296415 RepID=UPI0004719526|nr:T9SS type A sorting domain-containing protein [Aquimarina pacifica]
MKKLNYWGLVFFTLLCFDIGYAQIEEEQEVGLTCDQKADLLQRNWANSDQFSEELKREMLEYIQPCINQGNSDADYMYATLVFLQETTTEETATGVSILKRLADEDRNVDAMRMLGIYYKNAFDIHTMNRSKLDAYLAESLYWFEEAEDNGDDFSKYALGYYYLKGLGNTDPDYDRAMEHFERSDQPMAKHWEAVMHYFGYEEREDQEKGIELLLENDIINSQTLASFLSEQQPTVYTLSEDYEQAIYEYQEDISSLLVDDLVANFSGVFAEFCWQGEQIKRAAPINIKFEQGSDNHELEYQITLLDTTITGTGQFSDNTLYLDHTLPVKNMYKDNPVADYITYQITDIVFDEVNGSSDDPDIMVGRVNGALLEYNEPLPPIFVALYKGSSTPVDPEDVDYRIYPNPMSFYVNVQYDIEELNTTFVEIYDQMGILKVSSDVSVEEKSVSLRFDVRDYPEGIYFVKIHIGDTVIDATVVKD